MTILTAKTTSKPATVGFNMPARNVGSDTKTKRGKRAFMVAGVSEPVLANYPAEIFQVFGKVKLRVLPNIPRNAIDLGALI